MSEIGMRPFLASDAARCMSIFSASIAELAREDYDDQQCEAWIATADDKRAFGQRMLDSLTLVATIDGNVAGFASLKHGDVLDMIYVDPDFARKGVGSALLDALTKLAAARGAKALSADVSDTAKPLFDMSGFLSQRRNLVPLGDQWLANTTMTKSLMRPDRSAGH